jgi:ferredoxin-nitrite reductase
MNAIAFTEEQEQYLKGFAAGSGLGPRLQGVATFATGEAVAPAVAGPQLPVGPEAIHYQAQDRQLAAGKKLCAEEQAKRKTFPLDQWNDLRQHAADEQFPKGTNVLAFKYQGLFYVAPVQNSYMVRLRFAGGMLPSFQARAVAEAAEKYGGGYIDCTTRSNLQLREVKAKDGVNVLELLHDAGVVIRGSGADNIRNVTGSPTAGIDPVELHDTRGLAREMHHYILNHREMYGLPRKFNIAFDGGGSISAVEDTNDIGFSAVRVAEGSVDDQGMPVEGGVYYRMALGGITGHKDFARDTGVLLRAEECVPVAAAVVRVFIDHGDRSDRRKARLKYVLDAWGFEKFMHETENILGRRLRRLAVEKCEARAAVVKHGHLGFHPQKQAGLFYVGVLLAVGRVTVGQMRGLADIADRHGSGLIRLTVWQNLLISDIPEAKIESVKKEIEALGLHWDATNSRGGLIACTGAAGCKYAMAHTKQHAALVADYLDTHVKLDQPINLHLTGCPNSCAQHYMGDIGMIGTKVVVGEGESEKEVEGYHIFVGGGYGVDQSIGREMYRSVTAENLPMTIGKMLRGYMAQRRGADESFNQFVRRSETSDLVNLFNSVQES